MPDREREERLADTFVASARRDRYKQFLASRKRRREILDRLYHMFWFDLAPGVAAEVPRSRQGAETMRALLHRKGAGETVYVLSAGLEWDGLEWPLNEIPLRLHNLDGAVVCCVPGRLACWLEEKPGGVFVLEKETAPPVK